MCTECRQDLLYFTMPFDFWWSGISSDIPLLAELSAESWGQRSPMKSMISFTLLSKLAFKGPCACRPVIEQHRLHSIVQLQKLIGWSGDGGTEGLNVVVKGFSVYLMYKQINSTRYGLQQITWQMITWGWRRTSQSSSWPSPADLCSGRIWCTWEGGDREVGLVQQGHTWSSCHWSSDRTGERRRCQRTTWSRKYQTRSQDDSQLLPVWIVHILLSDLVGLGVHVDGVVGLAAHVVLPDDAALLPHLHRIYHWIEFSWLR